mmetsp:Transcript_116922/g.261243  ORF Transcript_116922/g.261243 Transcript_116922/m.261243 type:complete len:200 (+) Transcript_116922:94-693(+)
MSSPWPLGSRKMSSSGMQRLRRSRRCLSYRRRQRHLHHSAPTPFARRRRREQRWQQSQRRQSLRPQSRWRQGRRRQSRRLQQRLPLCHPLRLPFSLPLSLRLIFRQPWPLAQDLCLRHQRPGVVAQPRPREQGRRRRLSPSSPRSGRRDTRQLLSSWRRFSRCGGRSGRRHAQRDRRGLVLVAAPSRAISLCSAALARR